MNETRYPLCWPEGVPRSKYRSSNNTWKQDSDRVRTDLLAELERLNVEDIIISTNARRRRLSRSDGGTQRAARSAALAEIAAAVGER